MRFDHIETAFGYTLKSFSQNADSVSLCVTGPGGHEVEIECDYLVRCDGASSAIRSLLGISLAGSTFSERWLVVDLENAENSSPHTKVFCNPRRPCIALPGPDQTRHFEFKLHSYEQDKDLLAPEMIQSLLAAHKANPHSVIVRKAVYRFHARLATQWSQGRVFLAGDAAHLTPPLPPMTKRRPGPAKPKYGIPPADWPMVQRRVLENQESLRKVANDYGVSYETVRRTVIVARKPLQAR